MCCGMCSVRSAQSQVCRSVCQSASLPSTADALDACIVTMTCMPETEHARKTLALCDSRPRQRASSGTRPESRAMRVGGGGVVVVVVVVDAAPFLSARPRVSSFVRCSPPAARSSLCIRKYAANFRSTTTRRLVIGPSSCTALHTRVCSYTCVCESVVVSMYVHRT